MEKLVEGTYFKVLKLSNVYLLIQTVGTVHPREQAVIHEVLGAKLFDCDNEFIARLDPFNSKMIAELQNTIEFCFNCIDDWKGGKK